MVVLPIVVLSTFVYQGCGGGLDGVPPAELQHVHLVTLIVGDEDAGAADAHAVELTWLGLGLGLG